MNLFNDIRDERFDIGSSTIFPTYNQSTSDAGRAGMPIEFHRYFSHHMLRTIDLIDPMDFDLLDF